ncbi:hemolysin family protein [Caviibacter abscessus]|uniref:hemolysin family protein n=1 Tax=Caviibacter abscessus TaxID=1766719 RepID=UPI000A60AF98|nr:hemolysin family protein [Caviibacter abscessus]
MDILPQILFILILICINGFFSCAEIAIVSVNKSKLKVLIENKDIRAIRLQKLIDSPSKMLSTIQVAITLSGFLASASAAISISDKLHLILENLNIPYTRQLSVFIITILLSYITLILGELVPKRIGMQNSYKISLKVAGIITFISIIFTPIIAILTISTNMVVCLFGQKKSKSQDDISKEEILAVINSGSLEENEKEMLENIIEFDEKFAREVMIPRPSIYAIPNDTPIYKLFDMDDITRYSRIPVYDNNLDNIIGILHTKDLIKISRDSKDTVESIIKEAYFVPDTKKISSLFIEMKKQNKHLAILIDEYGGVSGIVTLEDLIEEVVGEITDEYDKEVHDITEIGKNKYLISAELSISDLNDFFKTNFDSDYYDSVGGLLIEKLGFIPDDNQRIDEIIIDNTCFKIQKVKNKKIQKIIITRKEENNV